MAYKFQRGEAILSGALLQEGNIEIESGFEFAMHDETVLDTSRNLTVAGMSGSGNLQVGGTATIAGAADLNGALQVAGDVQLDGAGDTALNVAADSFYFFDADNSLVKRDTMADYATAVAGNGLSASAGQVALSSTAAGAGLTYSAGVLAVGVDDTGIEIDSDALRLKDSGVVTDKIADDAVTPAKMSLFDDSLAATDTHILIADGTDYSSFAMSGDATLSNAGVLTIAAGAVEDSMLADNVATGLAGDGLGASSGVLAVQVSGAIAIHSDYVGLSGSVAGDGLTFAGGADSISALSLDISEYATVQVASGDKFLMLDSDGLTEQLETVDSLVEFMAGEGLAQSSGVLSLDLNELTAEVIASGDFLAFVDSDDNGTHKETVDDLADLFAGAGLVASSAVIAVANATNGGIGVHADSISLDFDDLSEVAVDVANDSFAFVDASDSNITRKETIADLVAAMAGNGLTATNGVLSADSAVTPALKISGSTLQEGYNYFDDIGSSDAVVGVDLPASPTAGDVVHVKAGNLAEDKYVRISVQGSHFIDDTESSIDLESPYAAVSLVYVAANKWRIV